MKPLNPPAPVNNRPFTNNALWFIASLILASWVWFVATTAGNPVGERRFNSISVQLEHSSDIVVTNDYTRSVRVNVLAQQSVRDLLTTDDIVVFADLQEMEPGTYTVPLQVQVARNAVADTQPTQITVTLERVDAQQKPVSVVVLNDPPVDYAYDPPTPAIFQAEVRGASSRVSQVSSLRAEIDLAEKRNPLTIDAVLVPVNAEGQRVEGVTIEPRAVSTSIHIFQRDDVRQISISPRILGRTLPNGYLLSTISYEPQTIFVSGPAATLSTLTDTFYTASIDLSGQTADFETTVPIEIPDDTISILDGQTTVKITVGVVAQTSVEQIDNIALRVDGLAAAYEATLTPENVSVVLNGPVSVLNSITSTDVQAVIDVTGLEPGNYEVVPEIIIKNGTVTVSSITLLPPNIKITIINLQATPEATPPVSATP